jgi:DNA-binding NtrC family response regulator
LDALAEYHWPGNVRELRNVLERALILSDKKRIMIKDVGKLNTSTENSGEHADLSFSVSISKGQSLREALREAERGVATEALRRSGGSVKNAARELGISRDQMKYLMKSLGIRRNIYPEVSLNGVSFTRH